MQQSGTNLVNMKPLFENPFSIEDMLIFDDVTLQRMFSKGGFGLTLEDLAASLCGAPEQLVRRVRRNFPDEQQKTLSEMLHQRIPSEAVQSARRSVLNGLFWELTYWKTPELYEELTEGEQLHPDIFRQLASDLCGKTVLDIGAGSGRASFECLCQGAKLIYAIEPSPGLLHILEQKLTKQPINNRIAIQRGCFDSIPLPDNSVDVSLSCSAFTADEEQGGEPGLAEMRRVTKRGGKIVLIWPRREDHAWLIAHGFQYVTLPLQQEMCVRFRSLQSALHCARLFYAHNRAVQRYILQHRKPEVPFSVLEINPPHDYCWLTVS